MNAHPARRPSSTFARRHSTLRLFVLHLTITFLGALLLTTGLLA